MWGERIIFFFDVQDTPGSAKDSGNALPSRFRFESTGREGKKGPKFPAKKAGKALQNGPSGKTERDGYKLGK